MSKLKIFSNFDRAMNLLISSHCVHGVTEGHSGFKIPRESKLGAIRGNGFVRSWFNFMNTTEQHEWQDIELQIRKIGEAEWFTVVRPHGTGSFLIEDGSSVDAEMIEAYAIPYIHCNHFNTFAKVYWQLSYAEGKIDLDELVLVDGYLENGMEIIDMYCKANFNKGCFARAFLGVFPFMQTTDNVDCSRPKDDSMCQMLTTQKGWHKYCEAKSQVDLETKED